MITSHVLGESELILVFLNTKIGLLVNVLNAHMNPMIIVSFLYWLGIQYFQETIVGSLVVKKVMRTVYERWCMVTLSSVQESSVNLF